MPKQIVYGKTVVKGSDNEKKFSDSITMSASGNTFQDALDALHETSKNKVNELLHKRNPIIKPEITETDVIIEKIIIDDDDSYEKDIILHKQSELQFLTKEDYYYTYYDKDYIPFEPVKYLDDVFCVSFNFWFSKEEQIYPYFYFIKDGVAHEKQLNSLTSKIDGFINITFGPFQKLIQENRPDKVYIAIKTNKNIIFFKHHQIEKFEDYSFAPKNEKNSIHLKMMFASCFSIPGYREPAPIQPELYDKFTKTAKELKADCVLSVGDLVYLEPLNLTSDLSIQSAYIQLKEYTSLQGLFSNSTWITCNDDHEFSYNDGNRNSPLIKLLRTKMTDNFPLISQVSSEYRADVNIKKNITFVSLDTVSCRTLNPKPSGYNKFLSILGENQLNFLLDSLSNVYSTFGKKSLCFVLVGKSMFGEQSETTFLFCPTEREQILKHIELLGLKNVCFLCGDSHFSDVSEYKFNNENNQIVREIRCSAIGSRPRSGDVNKNRVVGSLVNTNNFGTLDIQGTKEKYTVIYNNCTTDKTAYSYQWITD